MIKKIGFKIGDSSGWGLFHNSRQDVVTLSKAINKLIEKQNEVIEAINRLEEKK